jgi:hypothetical protein
MLIKTNFLPIIICAGSMLLAQPLRAQSPSTQTWDLPHATAVKDAGPRSYHFSVIYYTANRTGEVIHRQQVTGDYTRGLPNGEVQWKNVVDAQVDGATAPFPATPKSDFMEGFRYRNDIGATMSPDFFKSFPPSAIMERNLVWDTGMFEMFGQEFFDQLKLNEPLHIDKDQDVKLPDVGTFRNRDVVLEWVGRSQRNGQDCALIDYHAFFNPVTIAMGGMTMNARSDYWGEIWVSLATKQIEFATLNEEVNGEIKLPGQDAPQLLDVFRIGTFEPVTVTNSIPAAD